MQKTDCTPLQDLWQTFTELKPEATVEEYCEKILGILSVAELKVKAGQLYKEGQITLTGFKNIACAHDALTLLLQSLPQDYLAGGCGNKNP